MREFTKDEQGRYQARVLVVEDDPILRTQLRYMVAKRVTEVREAPDGMAGLAAWREWVPDLVITDVLMPKMDGLEMSEIIRAEDPYAQIIVVTSSSEARHLRQALDIGIDRYVMKPLDEAFLLDALRKCLRDLQGIRDLHLARLVFESVSEGVMVTDDRGRILVVNPTFCELTGFREDEVLGQGAGILSSGTHDAAFYQAMWDSLKSLGRWAGEIVNRRKDGQHYTEWLSIVAVEEASRRATRYVGLFSDITERKREEERIRRMAHFDLLTGLPNRALFLDRLKRALSRVDRRGGDLALLFLDLDRFKPINDLHGHAFGDQVLIEAARRMTASVRAVDMVSRHGGDEFVILIEASDAREAAANVAAKLIDTISQPYTVWGREVVLGASLGVAIYPEDGKSADALLESADAALYNAKRAGRGQFRFFAHSDQLDVESRLSLEDALTEGVSEGRFELRYLPEISLSTGRVERLEALLRFRHPKQGLMEAGHFLELAERLGLMPTLGLQTLRAASQVLAQPACKDIGLTLDISARQLVSLDDPGLVLHWLEQAGIRPDRVMFEFPEQAVTGNEEGLRVLYNLHSLGFACGLDDFGAGYCSFSLLRQLPLASIKIDLSFVHEMEHSEQFRELVAALIAFGKRLGLRTVAEGVTCPSQLAFLRESGCDAVQGYLFGEPMAADALTEYLATAPWRQYF